MTSDKWQVARNWQESWQEEEKLADRITRRASVSSGFRASGSGLYRRLGLFAVLTATMGATVISASANDVFATTTQERAATGRRQPIVGEGAAITPEFARALFDQIAALQETDGCRLVRFDTSRFRITVGLRTASGTEHDLEFAATRAGRGARRVGDWALAVPAELQRECARTVAAIERLLSRTAAPWGSRRHFDWFKWDAGERLFMETNYPVLAASFLLLVLGTLHILFREARAKRPSPYAVGALVLVWGVALALRLELSPRTFLHEYYHVAETIAGYLKGENPPTYGNTGPALYRLVGALLGRQDDVEIIFLTNAVISSLAIPAVALLDLALMRSWPRAICTAVLLCILPQHLRFSAAEDLFVLAVTFSMWTLALFALYLRTHRLEDALLSALALSLAMQARPETIFLPAVLVALVLLAQPRQWRVLFAWRTLLALGVAAALLIPRFLDLQRAVQYGSPTPVLPGIHRYFWDLMLLDEQVTPPVYLLLLAVGLAWGLWRRPGVQVWVILVFVGYTLFSMSLFGNPQFNLRSQLLPTSFTVLIAAGSASAWMALWGRRQQMAIALGACALAALAAAVVIRSQDFVTELRDQQLEWLFLERTVPQLPQRGALLSAVEIGRFNLNAFPQFLLEREGKIYEMVDVRRAAAADLPWPEPGDDLLFYQGMFCHFAAHPDEPKPDPMSAPCNAVHARYLLEPLFIEDLDTEGYSMMPYAEGPFRIGFYRVRGLR